MVPSPPPSIEGTEGADTFSVTFSGTIATVDVNGTEYTFPWNEHDQISLDGLGGNDTLTIFDEAADNEAELRPFSVYLQSVLSGNSVLGEGFEDIQVIGLGGYDVATFYDSSGNDTLTGDSRSTRITGNGYRNRVTLYDRIEAHASEGTFDYAYFNGDFENSTPVRETFIASPDSGEMTVGDWSQFADGFDAYFGAASPGGNDTAILIDSAGDDTLFSREVSNNGVYFDATLVFENGTSGVVARDFASVSIDAINGGVNKAEFEGHDGDDQFTIGFDSSIWSGMGLQHTANGFDEITVLDSTGVDYATLLDSTGNDEFRGYADRVELDWFVSEENDPIRTVVVNGVDEVIVRSTDGQDLALLNGTAGDETFNSDDDNTQLVGDGFVLKTEGYFEVRAISGGGSDTAIFGDSAGDDFFSSSPLDATMSMPTMTVSATEFATVIVVAAKGGEDRADLDGSSSSDEVLDASPTSVTLSSEGWQVTATGFGAVDAQGYEGNDVANYTDGAGDDLFLIEKSNTQLTHDGGVVIAKGFNTHIAVSENGGNDEATIVGSSRDDILSGDLASVTLTSEFYLLQATGFAKVNVDGGDGEDVVMLAEEASDNRAEFRPRSVRVESAERGSFIFAEDFESMTVNSLGGNGIAEFFESIYYDEFLARPSYSELNSFEYQQTAIGYPRIIAHSDDIENGSDRAAFISEAEGLDESFTVSEEEARMVIGDWSVEANGFSYYFGSAKPGGNDRAVIADSSRSDRFYVQETLSNGIYEIDARMDYRRDGLNVVARSFTEVEVIATPGREDLAFLIGTDGDDVFNVNQDSVQQTGSGIEYTLTGFYSTTIAESEGFDRIYAADSPSDDLFVQTLSATDIRYGIQNDGSYGSEVSVGRPEELFVSGGVGHDVARLLADEGVEDFYFSDTKIEFSGEGYFGQIVGYDETIVEGVGPEDHVTLVDSAGDDLFQANTEAITLTMPSHVVEIQGALSATVISENGGQDVAVFDATQADEVITASSDAVVLVNPDWRWQAIGFAQVTVNGGGGADEATLNGSVNDDVLTGGPSHIEFTTAGVEIVVDNVPTVFANAVNGGSDVANLIGSMGDDQVTAGFNAGVFSGDLVGIGYSIRTKGFDNVDFVGNGGNDVANLSDSSADDTLTFNPVVTSLTGAGRETVLVGFSEIMVDATKGGHDTATLLGSEGDDHFVGGSESLNLSAGGVTVAGSGFNVVTVDAIAGNDTAALTDSVGDDTFNGSPVAANWMMSNVLIDLGGFENVTVDSTSGNDTAIFLGSEGDETLFTSDVSATFKYDGVDQRVNGFGDVEVNGHGGFDRAYFTDSSGDDQFEASPGFATLTMPAAVIAANGFEFLGATGTKGGTDTAILSGGGNADTFFANSEFGRFFGEGFVLNAANFTHIEVTGGVGDKASVIDSAGDDVFEARFGFASMTMPGKSIEMTGFDRVSGFSQKGGNDFASLSGTDGNDEFFGAPESATIKGANFQLVAAGFPRADVDAAGGTDTAFLFGTAESDELLIASPSQTYMRGSTFFNVTNGFGEVTGFSKGGTDLAILGGSDGDDDLYASPNLTRLSGSGYITRSIGFATVRADAKAGNDLATMIDSAGNDVFTAQPNHASLSGVGFKNIAMRFEQVNAFGSSGNDIANVTDSAGNDLYYANAILSYVSGNGFHNQAIGFDRFTATASRGGSDTARMFDSEGDDLFRGIAANATMVSPGVQNFAVGFEKVFAQGSDKGTNRLELLDIEFEFFQTGFWV